MAEIKIFNEPFLELGKSDFRIQTSYEKLRVYSFIWYV